MSEEISFAMTVLLQDHLDCLIYRIENILCWLIILSHFFINILPHLFFCAICKHKQGRNTQSNSLTFFFFCVSSSYISFGTNILKHHIKNYLFSFNKLRINKHEYELRHNMRKWAKKNYLSWISTVFLLLEIK